MDDHELVQDAFEHAIAALERAACALTGPTMLAPRQSALPHDAHVLARAVEAEIVAPALGPLALPDGDCRRHCWRDANKHLADRQQVLSLSL